MNYALLDIENTCNSFNLLRSIAQAESLDTEDTIYVILNNNDMLVCNTTEQTFEHWNQPLESYDVDCEVADISAETASKYLMIQLRYLASAKGLILALSEVEGDEGMYRFTFNDYEDVDDPENFNTIELFASNKFARDEYTSLVLNAIKVFKEWRFADED